MALMSGRRLGCGRLGSYPAGTAVVAHAIHGNVIDDRLVVDVGDVRIADIGHRPVVIETVALPITPLVAAAAVPVTVIHAAIESDLRTPVAYIPYENATPIAPVARSPKETRLGSEDPCARYPVIILVVTAPGPIARCPKVALSGNRRLFIDRKLRRRHVD